MSNKDIFYSNDNEQEFFTTKQIAQILDMTPRTIRNFIKSNKLNAAKFGGEWRIRKKDLMNFMDDQFQNQYSEGRYKKMNSEVKDFLDGRHMEIEGPLQICTIIDIYDENKDNAVKTRNKIWNILNNKSREYNDFNFKGDWDYVNSENKGRFVFWTDSPDLIRNLIKPLSNKQAN
ncbi:helix-turn-helix domain-containing protein [Natronospora cellulosivora (SeqCode)]